MNDPAAATAELITRIVKDHFDPAMIAQIENTVAMRLQGDFEAMIDERIRAAVREEARRILREEVARRVVVTVAMDPAP